MAPGRLCHPWPPPHCITNLLSLTTQPSPDPEGTATLTPERPRHLPLDLPKLTQREAILMDQPHLLCLMPGLFSCNLFF